MKQINDYIFVHEFEQRRDRPNISLIKGKEFNLLVDFGISKAHLDEAINDFKSVGLDYPKMGVLTHYHYDHSFAIPYFKGVSVACKKSNEYLSLLEKIPMSDSFLNSYLSGESLKFCLDAIHEEYSDVRDIKVKQTDVSFNNYLKIDLGDKIVECYHLPSPHSDDAVYIKVNDVLFIGDAFFYDIFNGEKEFNREKLQAFLVIIESFDVNTIVEGHSEIKTKQELIEEIMSYL